MFQMAGGRRVRQSQNDGRWIIAGLMALLIFVQALMLHDGVRSKLSIVDFLEGQRVELEKK